jgi:hypothetical protein
MTAMRRSLKKTAAGRQDLINAGLKSSLKALHEPRMSPLTVPDLQLQFSSLCTLEMNSSYKLIVVSSLYFRRTNK